MFHQPYSALAEKKSVQVSALMFVVCFGIAMAVLDIRVGNYINLYLVIHILGLLFHKPSSPGDADEEQ